MTTDVSLTTAREILNYAQDEFKKATGIKGMLLYGNSADKSSLSMIIAFNSYISHNLGIISKSHSEHRFLLRRLTREGLRARYSGVMRILHEEPFYEGIYNPDKGS